ncbi:MAG: hypothetical protein ACFB21_07940 [Opitutales bacterium]
MATAATATSGASGTTIADIPDPSVGSSAGIASTTEVTAMIDFRNALTAL